jgi:hypothetical protein
MEQNLTPVYCATKLEAVELKLEELKARRLALLDKDEKSLSRREIAELAEYAELKAKLEAKEAYWCERLSKAQGILQVG